MGGDMVFFESLRSVLFERSLGGIVVSLGKEGSGDGEPVVDFPVFALGGGVDPEGVVLAAGVVEGGGHPLMGANPTSAPFHGNGAEVGLTPNPARHNMGHGIGIG